MKHHFIDRYSRKNSCISRMPVLIKFIALILMLFIIIIIKPGLLLFCYFFLFIILILSQVPVKFLILRIIIMMPFIFIIGLLAYLSDNNQWDIFIFTVLKSICSLGFVLFFSATTKFSEFVNFLRRLKTPAIFIHLLNFLYRYFFILANEYERMHKGFLMKKENKFFIYNLKIYFSMAGLLFIRSYERSFRIFYAMLMKGYRI